MFIQLTNYYGETFHIAVEKITTLKWNNVTNFTEITSDLCGGVIEVWEFPETVQKLIETAKQNSLKNKLKEVAL